MARKFFDSRTRTYVDTPNLYTLDRPAPGATVAPDATPTPSFAAPSSASRVLNKSTGAQTVLGDPTNDPGAGTAQTPPPAPKATAFTPNATPSGFTGFSPASALAASRYIEAVNGAVPSSSPTAVLRSTAANPSATARRYASGGDFNTAQATQDHAAGKITDAQLAEVRNASATNLRGVQPGVSEASRAMMSGRVSPARQQQLSREAQSAASDAYDRTHPGETQARAAASGTYGKTGQVNDPDSPLTPGGGAVVAFRDPKTGKATQSVVTGGPNVSGESGIKVNGQWVDTKGNATQPTQYEAPLSRQDQINAAVKAYPALASATSPENNAFLKAYNQAGEGANILDLAHGLFAPKTQAQVLAQSKAANQAETDKASADARANRTPEQVAADTARQNANAAKVAAAGKTVYDPDATGQNAARTITNAYKGGDLDEVKRYYSDPSTPGGGIVSGVKNFFTGFGAGDATPAVPTPAPVTPKTPVNGAIDPQTGLPTAPSKTVPGGALGATAPATPVTSPPVPGAPTPAGGVTDFPTFDRPGASKSTASTDVFAPIRPPAPAITPGVDPEEIRRRKAGAFAGMYA